MISSVSYDFRVELHCSKTGAGGSLCLLAVVVPDAAYGIALY